MSSYIMEPNLMHPLTLHLNQQQQRSSLAPLMNNSNINPHGYSTFPYTINNYPNNHNQDDDEDDEDEHVDVDDDDDDQEEIEDVPPARPQLQVVDKPRPSHIANGHTNVHANGHTSRPSAPKALEITSAKLSDYGNHGYPKGPSVSISSASKHDISTSGVASTVAAESETPKRTASQGASSRGMETPSANEIELLKENRELRKKVEHLMRHNMKLMEGIKDRDHKAYKHKLRLAKYRKALLRFFEQEVSEPSSGDEDVTDSAEDHKSHSTTPVVKKERSSLHALSPSPPSEPTPASPNSTIEFDYDDISPVENTSSRKRKHEGDFDSVPERKRRSGTRRNALWTSEDDEKFTQAYNTFGKSWKSIHECLPDKTREQVQSHGQYLIRIGKLEDVKGNTKRGRKKNKKEKSKEEQPSSPSQPASPLYTQFHSQHSPSILTPPPIPSFAQ